MRIQIETSPVGPLSTLSELPSADLALLEGLNGIGKTLSVRLLQICTGFMPYNTDSPAWRSLCEGLGEFRVVISELVDVDQITWRADSRQWQAGVGLGMDAVKFIEILIDDRPADLADVRNVLIVERIGGDESLVDTLAQQAEADGTAVRAWSSRYAAAESGPLAALEARVAATKDLLPSWDSARYRDTAERAQVLTARKRTLDLAVRRANERRTSLQSAIELSGRLAELRERAPELEARLKSVDAAIASAQRERARLDRQIAELAGKVAMAAPAKRELRNARNTLDRNRGNLQRAASLAATLAGPLGIPSDDPAAADEYLVELTEEIARLTAAQTELDAAPAMRQLLEGLTVGLTDAEHRGLGDQVALETEDGRYSLTVKETRGGFVTRRAHLEGQPPPPEAREVADRLASAQKNFSRAKALVGAQGDVRRYQRLVSQSEERVTNALVAADPRAEEEMRALDQARRESDDKMLDLAAERAGLQEQLGTSGGPSAERSLAEQLADALTDSGSTEARLTEDARKADEDLTRLQHELHDVEQTLHSAARELDRMEADTHAASQELSGEASSWLVRALPDADRPAPESPAAEQLHRLDRIGSKLDAILDRLGSFRVQLGAITSAFQAIAEHLRGGESSNGAYVTSIEAWLGNRFSAWFDLPRVREQLLPSAEGEVRVDVRHRTVTWTEGGAARSRPLEAFSSGEQAFAYTRARIGVLDEQVHRPANRLIVLDEFGAFISHDRMGQLLTYLRERVSQNPQDQVLVILPLSRDYGELARTAIGSDAARFEGLADQIASRKYAVQVLA